MSEEISSKTLRRLTFQEIIKLRKITDGTHNPYVNAEWIPEKDLESLVTEIQRRKAIYEKMLKRKFEVHRLEYKGKVWGYNDVLELLRVTKEQKKETENP